MSSEVLVRLPDGSERSLPMGSTGLDLAASIGRRLAKDALAIKVNGVERDLSEPLSDGALVEILTPTSPAGREVLRHSTSHVLAQAVLRLWPGAHYAIGPVIEDGFYYDFARAEPFTPDDLPKIEAKMHEIVKQARPTRRRSHRR